MKVSRLTSFLLFLFVLGILPGSSMSLKNVWSEEGLCQAAGTQTIKAKPETNPVRMLVPLTKAEQNTIATLKPGQVVQKTITISGDREAAMRNCCSGNDCCCTCQCDPAPCICNCTDDIVVK